MSDLRQWAREKRSKWTSVDWQLIEAGERGVHDGPAMTHDELQAVLADLREVAEGLTAHQAKTLLRAKDSFAHRPEINSRSVRVSAMRRLRDAWELVEDGLGLWRRTDFGRAVARYLERQQGGSDGG